MAELYPNQIDEDFAFILNHISTEEVTTALHKVQQRVSSFVLRGHLIQADTDSDTSSRRVRLIEAELSNRLETFKYGKILCFVLTSKAYVNLYFTALNYVTERGVNLSTPLGGLAEAEFNIHCSRREFTKEHLSKLIHLNGGTYKLTDRKDELVAKLRLCLKGSLSERLGGEPLSVGGPSVIFGHQSRGAVINTGMSTRSRETASLIDSMRGMTVSPPFVTSRGGGGGG